MKLLSAALNKEHSEHVDLEEAMFAGGGRSRNSKTSLSQPRRELWCNNCNETGHMHKDCTKNCCMLWCNAALGMEHKKGCKYRWVIRQAVGEAKMKTNRCIRAGQPEGEAELSTSPWTKVLGGHAQTQGGLAHRRSRDHTQRVPVYG